ncbi:MAG: exodeoxyribonuclease III [Ignavibacteria bacterium]|nr:exodeoxyribonuclease III [Ignavibacteria bacterium]
MKKKIKIYSFNINGIRAAFKKGLNEWIKINSPDILCLQEIKATLEQLPDDIININNYRSYWFPAKRKGYSGVAVYTKLMPDDVVYGIRNEIFDDEGRAILLEYDKFLLVNAYFPNGGRNEERLVYKLNFYDEIFFFINKNYSGKKGIVITGDFNTAHKEKDVAKPDKWSSVSGFLTVEREWIDKLINMGYVDIFRKFNTEGGNYTFWDPITRAKVRNEGWRIDYFMVSQDIADKIISAEIHPEVEISDHCPVSIDLTV